MAGKNFIKVYSIALMIIGFLGALIFITSNLTGNAIGASDISNWLGSILFVVGICGAVGYLNNRRKSKIVPKRKRTKVSSKVKKSKKKRK